MTDAISMQDIPQEELKKINEATTRPIVEKLITKITESKKFKSSLEEPVRKEDEVIGEMTDRQKALLTIFSNNGIAMLIRKVAYKMIQEDIRKDPRIINNDSKKTGLGMCKEYTIVLY